MWVVRKVRVDTVLTRTRFHFCSRLHLKFMEELEVSRYPSSGFPRGSKGLRSSTKFSLNSCSQSGKSCSRSLCTSSCPSFLFMFSVSVDSCSGSPRSSSHVLALLSGTGFSVYVLSSNTESCDEDVEEVGVGVVEELVDKPGTTNGTWFDILQSILLPFLVRCGFLTAGPVVSIPMILAVLPERKNCGCFFKKHHRHEEVQFFDICRGFFSDLHLAVGRYHRRRISRYY